ncbi:MAG: hypothetical protein RML35_14650 [Chloroherpetonaceae bacterium]|nr:hypothetical protein [Chloroherpetonaceae bacterium]
MPPSERLFGTIAANTIALMHGANILRVHDVKATVETIEVFLATMQSNSVEERNDVPI